MTRFRVRTTTVHCVSEKKREITVIICAQGIERKWVKQKYNHGVITVAIHVKCNRQVIGDLFHADEQ